MALKLVLARDGEVLLEIPLSARHWPRERLGEELEGIEEDLNRLSRLLDALSSTVRLRMMKKLFENDELMLSFSDFMRGLGLNPKIVSEGAKRLQEEGLLERSEDGRYRCSELGQAGFFMAGIALRHLLRALRASEGYWDE
jgi:DNA-binding transcriptional ArsR family regulator